MKLQIILICGYSIACEVAKIPLKDHHFCTFCCRNLLLLTAFPRSKREGFFNAP